MESRVRDFILDKAVGLLQSFKTKLPPKISGDIESGLSDDTQPSPINDRLQHCSGRERSGSTPGDPRGSDAQVTNLPLNEPIEQGVKQPPQSTISSSNGPIEQGVNQQPQFTEGPARFVIANDGSKDCMALLVTDTLIAKLRDLYEDRHHLSGRQGPLDYARREARRFENSINQCKESIEAAENQEEVEKLRETIQQQEPHLLLVRQRRDELEKGAKELERNVTSSKAHIQWVLDTAMKEADLLEPHRPLTPVTMTDIESEPGTQEEIHQDTHNGEGTKNGDHNAVDKVVLPNTDDVPEELQSLRRAAWESYDEALVTMHKVQALFDNRQQSYETDLADYQQGFASGIYDISRSEFDRSKIRYGQKVTRALIDAEEAFETAKEHAQAVATKDWSHVHDWLAELPEPSNPEEVEMGVEAPEVDDWYAEEVDPADSISQVDFDECRKDIDRWENIRFDRWEDMRTQVGGPQVQMGFLVRSIEALKRRHSVSLCRSNVGEWETST